MDIASVESSLCQVKLVGERQDDGTLTLTDGTNMADWPETLTLVSGTVMRLANVPHPNADMVVNPETAWYEL
jgi:hypothetical protein